MAHDLDLVNAARNAKSAADRVRAQADCDDCEDLAKVVETLAAALEKHGSKNF